MKKIDELLAGASGIQARLGPILHHVRNTARAEGKEQKLGNNAGNVQQRFTGKIYISGKIKLYVYQLLISFYTVFYRVSRKK